MRQSCTVFIEVDAEKAIKDGIEFFISENNVILSRGINGVIQPVNTKTHHLLSSLNRNTSKKCQSVIKED